MVLKRIVFISCRRKYLIKKKKTVDAVVKIFRELEMDLHFQVTFESKCL